MYQTSICRKKHKKHLKRPKESQNRPRKNYFFSKKIRHFECFRLSYNSSNNVVKEIQFVDAHPTSLSSLPFEVTNENVNYLTAVVEFNYSYYKFV